MQVILLETVGTLGKLGDTVQVKGGFGRNYLIPFGKAVAATPANIERFEAQRAELEAAEAEKLRIARDRAEKLHGLDVITITANAGEGGKLFGSIGTQNIADAVTAAGVEVERAEVKMPEGAIREIGEYEFDIQVHPDVTQAVKVAIVAVAEE